MEATDKIFFNAGFIAGSEFYKNKISCNGDFAFLFDILEKVLIEHKIGILRVETLDEENMSAVITIAEDLDCSGLPVCDEVICTFDEGFLSGILYSHTKINFTVKETDCWCTGDRVCRFVISKA